MNAKKFFVKAFLLVALFTNISGCYQEVEVLPIGDAPWECGAGFFKRFDNAYTQNQFTAQAKTEDEARVKVLDQCREKRKTYPAGCNVEYCRNLVTGELNYYENGKKR